MILYSISSVEYQHIIYEIKRSTFCRKHFKMHFNQREAILIQITLISVSDDLFDRRQTISEYMYI